MSAGWQQAQDDLEWCRGPAIASRLLNEYIGDRLEVAMIRVLARFFLFLLMSGCSNAGQGYRAVRLFDCSGAALQVYDGDTISCGQEVIRVLGIDTPEIRNEQFGMMEDQPFGPEATAYADKLLRSAGKVTVLATGKDRHGRTLGHVFADEALLGVKMLEAGLAHETISVYGDNGFAGLAALLLDTAGRGSTPQFENPSEWRRRHRTQRQ